MPKKIPDLEKKILEQAKELFAKQGFNAVDMKQVAAAAGTSVGNLYNYYPSKPELFIAIAKSWRSDLLTRLRPVLDADASDREKLLTVLKKLYRDVLTVKGLWKEFTGGGENEALGAKASEGLKKGGFKHLTPEEQKFFAEIGALIERNLPQNRASNPNGTGTPPKSEAGANRWALLIVTAAVQMAVRFPEEEEANQAFLETLASLILVPKEGPHV